MSCTHDCGCTPETRDARTDEWVQIAPESARAATLTPEQPVKAPVEGEDSPSPSEPVLPRRIAPEDVRVGMVIERRKGDAAVRDRVQRIDGDRIMGVIGAYLWMPGYEVIDWTLWLVEDAPAPVDPDADVIERVAQVLHKQGCSSCDTGKDLDAHSGSAREAWLKDARDVLAAVLETPAMTPRAEQ